jgi:restriction system protein
MARRYFKLLLGPKSVYAKQCFDEGFIGGYFGFDNDLSHDLEEDWRDFNHKMIPEYLKKNPGKSKIAAGLACGALWTITKGIQKGDIVIAPNGHGKFLFCEVLGDYEFVQSDVLPHRRVVKWYPLEVSRKEVSEGLRSSTVSVGPVAEITQHGKEIEEYLSGRVPVDGVPTELAEDTSVFALEKHLEEFLVRNWRSTDLGKTYDIYEEDGEMVGQQYPSDTGPIDILAISKDKKELLVIELKRGRVSDVVVGQIQRYMGYVQAELSEPGQLVKGVIIGLEDDLRIRRALSVANNIEFYRYQVSFKLFKG